MTRQLSVLVAAGVLGLAAGVPSPVRGGHPDPGPDGPEAVKVYYTEPQALAEVFAGADTTWAETWRPDDAERRAVEERLGWHLTEDAFVFHRAARAGRDLGWALVLEEKGRFKPITFLVHVGPGGRVAQVLVMVYRESRGDGVRRRRFLKQFEGRRADAPLRLNRDLVGVSGATLSSRALAVGVRKALVLTEVRYGERT